MRRTALPIVCAIVCAGPWVFTAMGDSDPGWHVAIGRLVLRGTLQRTNTLSWLYPDFPWYPTSWLYDALLAAMTDALPGALGGQLLTFALLAVIAVFTALACDRGGSPWAAPAIVVLLVTRLVPRPHVASLALTAALIALAPLSTRLRAMCVALVAIGGNVHPGAVFGAFVLGVESLEACWRTRRPIELALAAGAGLALFANPGVLFNAAYLLEHLVDVNDIVQLREFEPATPWVRPAFFVLLPLALLIAVHRRRERPALLVATVVFAALGLRAIRLVSDAQIVFAPSLAWGLSRLPWQRVIAVAAIPLAALSLRLRPPVLSTAWDARALPVRAARFLDHQDIGGRGFNAMRDGGYLIMARPRVPIFIDGRVQAFPPQLWRDLQEAEKSGPAFQAYLESAGCEWAVTTRVRERLGGYSLLHAAPGWAIVYWDDASEVYVRRDVARFAALRERLEYRQMHPWGHLVRGHPPADLAVLLMEIERFLGDTPGDPLALAARCAALKTLGRPCDR